MKGRWWIAGVAVVVCLVLALLLMPKPNTGGDVVAPTDGATTPTEDPPVEAVVRPGRPPAAERDPTHLRTGEKPGMERFLERRNRPEVVYAGKLIAPWAAVRYVLLTEGKDDGKALADELNKGVLTDLRGVRTAEDTKAAMDACEPEMVKAAETVKASRWASDPTVVQAMERYDALLAEYHQALDSQGVPAEPAEPAQADNAPAQENP